MESFGSIMSISSKWEFPRALALRRHESSHHISLHVSFYCGEFGISFESLPKPQKRRRSVGKRRKSRPRFSIPKSRGVKLQCSGDPTSHPSPATPIRGTQEWKVQIQVLEEEAQQTATARNFWIWVRWRKRKCRDGEEEIFWCDATSLSEMDSLWEDHAYLIDWRLKILIIV